MGNTEPQSGGSAEGADRPFFYRKPVLIAIIGAAALLLLLGAFFLRGAGSKTPGASTQRASETSKTATSGVAGSPGGVSPDAGTPSGENADAPAGQPGVRKPGQPKPPSNAAGTASSRAVKPAPTGSKLATVTAAPTRTISQLKVASDFKSASFEVSFSPYGWAPDGPEGKRLAVSVAEWKAVGETADIKDLSGENALFSMSAYEGRQVAVGGRYKGVVEVRAKDAGRGTLYLLSIE